MNKTLKEIISIVEENGGCVEPKTKTHIDYVATVSYAGGEVFELRVNGDLTSVSFSDLAGDRLLTFKIETEKGPMYVDFDYKHDFTMVYYDFTNEEVFDEFNETVDNNLHISILRVILKSIK